ncbi:hypothetical protein BSM4216_1023 [Bacillus smithii]|nr:hypothetical protein BSM4216_1023 [Bacillus smithii]
MWTIIFYRARKNRIPAVITGSSIQHMYSKSFIMNFLACILAKKPQTEKSKVKAFFPVIGK